MSADAFLEPVKEPSDANVDIVAVHGLNPFNGSDHAKSTWTAPNGKLWLRDFLPAQIPRARIFLFSYNANPAFSSGSEGVYQQANNLLVKLNVERDEAPDRPLIFICHSLGGLIVKRAMVQAQQSRTYEQLSNSVYGLVFFATPHRGGNNAGLGDVAAKIARFVVRTQSNSYLEALKSNSFFAEALRYDFRNRQEDFLILTFYETQPTKAGIIVNMDSAVLGLGDDRETVLGLEGDHSGLCRFGDENGLGYRPVWKSIKRLVENSLKRARNERTLIDLPVPNNDITEPETAGGLRDLDPFVRHVVAGNSNLLEFGAHYITTGLVDPRIYPDHATTAIPKTASGTGLQDFVTHLTHTSAYIRWTQESHGILWYTMGDQLGLSPIVATSSIISHNIPEAYVLYCKCRVKTTQNGEAAQGGKERPKKGSTAIEVLSALIIRYLRLGCLQRDSYQPELVRERLRQLAAHGIKLDVIWKAMATPAAPIRDLVSEFSKMLRIPTADGSEPIVVIDNLEALDSTGLLQLLRSLDSTVGKHTRILLSGTNGSLVQRTMSTVPQIDKDTEYQEYLQSLYFDDLHFRRDRVPNAQAGTNDWIFEHPEFRDWESDNAGILWIQGKPGSGKSVLAKSLVNRIVPQSSWKAKRGGDQTIVGWFYSRRDGAVTMAHASMFRSILYQVHQGNPKSFEVVSAVYRRKPPFVKGQDYSWSLEELESMLASVATSGLRMVCVLDGLDESENGEQTGLMREDALDKLLDIVSKGSSGRFKFIALSRPSNDIAQSFRRGLKKARQDTKQLKGYHKIVMQRENSRDIEAVVDHEVCNLQKLLQSFSDVDDDSNDSDDSGALTSLISSIGTDEDTGLKEIRKYLLDNAQGVILWVTLVVGTLKEHCRFGGVPIKELRLKLETLPPGLKELYEYIAEDLKKKLPEDILKKSKTILMLVSAASSVYPLTLQDLWDALAIPENIGDALLDKRDYRKEHGVRIKNWGEFCAILNEWCGPFLDVIDQGKRHSPHTRDRAKSESVRSTAVIQLLHQTVKDFLADSKASDYLHFTEQEATNVLKSTWTQYVEIQERRFSKFSLRDFDSRVTQAKEVVSFLQDKCLLLYFLKALGRLPDDHLTGLCNLMFELHVDAGQVLQARAALRIPMRQSFRGFGTFHMDRVEFWLRQKRNQYLRELFEEACSFGSPEAVECLLRLPEVDGSWWPANKAMVLNAALSSAVKASLHNTVRLLMRHTGMQDDARHDPEFPRQEHANKAFNEGNLDMYWAIHNPDGEIASALGSPEDLRRLKAVCADSFEPEALRKRIAHMHLQKSSPTRKGTPSYPAMSAKEAKAIETSIQAVIDYWQDQTFKVLSKKSHEKLDSKKTSISKRLELSTTNKSPLQPWGSLASDFGRLDLWSD